MQAESMLEAAAAVKKFVIQLAKLNWPTRAKPLCINWSCSAEEWRRAVLGLFWYDHCGCGTENCSACDCETVEKQDCNRRASGEIAFSL